MLEIVVFMVLLYALFFGLLFVVSRNDNRCRSIRSAQARADACGAPTIPSALERRFAAPPGS